MTWFKVDDQLHDHRKSRRAKKAAMGVWVLAGSWAAGKGTGGFVPADVLSRWGTERDAALLVEVGLWRTAVDKGERGWRFHNWDKYQPSEADEAAHKEKKARAGVESNHRRWHVGRDVKKDDCEFCQAVEA